MHTPLRQPQEVQIRRKQTPAPPKPDNLPEALFRNTSFITPKPGEYRQPLPPAPSSGMGFSELFPLLCLINLVTSARLLKCPKFYDIRVLARVYRSDKLRCTLRR